MGMGDMFEMMKKAASMQKQMKKIQKELAAKTVEASSGPVRATVRGDMSVAAVRIDPEALAAPNAAHLEKCIAAAVNSGLEAAKKVAGGEMAKMSGGLGGLADLLG